MGSRLEADLDLALGAFHVGLRIRTDAAAIAFVGPSGSGKSTALRILAGLERRARGTLTFDGETWQTTGVFVPPHRRRVGWVPQDAALFPHVDVRSNLGWAGASDGPIREMADRLGIGHLLERRPRHLSGGERQRVALGRALLARPRLLLLDEPFAALDDALRTRLATDLAALCRERELPFVVVSHHPSDVTQLAEEIWVVDQGEVRRR